MKGKMKFVTNGKMRFVLAVMLLAVCALVFGGEAAAKPSWLKTTWSSKIVVTGKDKTKGDYLSVRISIKHTNNGDEIITSFFNKTLKMVSTVKDYTSKGEYTLKSTKVNKAEVYPGQSYTLSYDIPLNGLIQTRSSGNRSGWQYTNEDMLRKDYSDAKKLTDGLKCNLYDVQVRTK
jgi:hypothetical protein